MIQYEKADFPYRIGCRFCHQTIAYSSTAELMDSSNDPVGDESFVCLSCRERMPLTGDGAVL